MLTPKEVAEKVIEAGVAKASLAWWKMILLGIFAGMFIALAGVGATFGAVYGGKIAGACVFTAGLAMVVVAGSELFTGNNLMAMAVLDGKIKISQMLKNWVLVFLGNLIGAVFVAAMVAVSGLFDSVFETVVMTAEVKVSMGFFEAVVRGVMCNFLVCIAVWMAFFAETAGGKIAAVLLPVMLFVLCGFEHSVANMFYVPAGMMMGAMNGGSVGLAETAGLAGLTGPAGLAVPTVLEFLLGNLLPVTIGNIIGGAVMVGGGYYLALMAWKKK